MNHKIIQDKPLTFTPIKIELILESEEELNELWGRLEMNINAVEKHLEERNQPIGKISPEDDPFYDLWDELDDIRTALKGNDGNES